MSELLFFIIGTMLGGVVGVVCMCLVQIDKVLYGLFNRFELEDISYIQVLYKGMEFTVFFNRQ